MDDEQPTTEKTVTPAADLHAPRQATPAEAAPVTSAPTPEPSVVAAPPESTTPPTDNDLAEEIAAEATTLPAAESAQPAAPAAAPVETPEVTATPVETPATPPTEQSQAVQDEIKQNEAQAVPTPEVPKAKNPARKAMVVAVVVIVVLLALAVFAYLSSK